MPLQRVPSLSTDSTDIASTDFVPDRARGRGLARYDALTATVMVLVVGYHCFTKQFAYVGLQSANIYVGEVFLAICLMRPRLIAFPWLSALLTWSELSPLAFALFTLVGYGIWESMRGILSGQPALPALQELAFNYYPIYIFIGLYVGRDRPELLSRIFRAMAIVNAIYGPLYVLLLAQTTQASLQSDINPGIWAWGQPNASVFGILGLLCYERRQSIAVPLILLNAFTMLGLQVRAEWLALTVTLIVWGVLHRKVGNVLAVWAAVLFILWAVDVTGVHIPGRVSNLSLRETVTRIIAPADMNAASRMSRAAQDDEGSVLFRTIWWHQIWHNVNGDPGLLLVGYGYGFPLRSLVADWDPNNPKDDVRSTHNVFFYALGYSGWLGVITFFSWQAIILFGCWRRYLLDGQSFPILYWIAAMIIGLLGNNFETPFGAVPFYLVCGIGLAPLFYAVPATRSYSPGA